MLNYQSDSLEQTKLIGMNIAEFSRKFPDRNKWRIASFNGHSTQPPSEQNPKRINLHIEAGIIKKISWG